MSPRVIILILSYNGKHLLDDSVSSYPDNNYDSFEVAVRDNGPTDGAMFYIQGKWPEVLS